MKRSAKSKFKKFNKITSAFLSISLISLAMCNSFNVSAAGNLAFSVGCNYTDGNSTARDAIKSCDYYALCGFSSRYTTKPTLSTLRGSYGGTKFMESDIIMLSGHGNSGGIYFDSKDTGAEFWVTTNTAATGCIILQNEYDMSKVKLVIFDGCETAKESSNCAQIVVNNGCKAAIGWTTSIGFDCMYEWKNKFNNYLATGNSISNALKIANSFNYGDNSCKNWKLYGNGSQVLKHSKSATQSNSLNTDFNPVILNQAISSENLTNKSTIANLIKCAYPDFSFDDFKIDLAMQNDDSGTITVVEKIGNYYSDNAYVLFYDGGKITEVFDRVENSIDRAAYSDDYFNLPQIDMEQVYAAARENISAEYTIENQKAEARIDSATGERYLLVGTTISINGAKSVLSYKYVIQ